VPVISGSVMRLDRVNHNTIRKALPPRYYWKCSKANCPKRAITSGRGEQATVLEERGNGLINPSLCFKCRGRV
jgi:hypothetical protein